LFYKWSAIKTLAML